jgi:hypothetical protein
MDFLDPRSAMTASGATQTFRNAAILSLWDGKRTLRKPYSASSIYEHAR